MKSRSLVLILLLAVLPKAALAITALPNQEVLQFEGMAPPGLGSPFLDHASFVEGSYAVFTPYGQWVDSEHPDLGIEHPDNGTDWFLNNDTGGIVITHRMSQQPFRIVSFDATQYSWVIPGGGKIEVLGTQAAGPDLSIEFSTAERLPGVVPTFQTFSLPPSWAGAMLNSVTITQPNQGFAVDNITLITVPEPSQTAIIAALLLAPVLRSKARWG